MAGSGVFSLALLIALPAALAKMGSPCDTAVRTTPLPTCSTFTCPDGWNNNVASTVCSTGHCNIATCCMATTVTTTPATTVTTTPSTTCVAFTCPDGTKQIGDEVVCVTGHCDRSTCCRDVPPPCTTVTTTPPPTCASFTCTNGYSANAGSTVCRMGECDAATCCAVILTTSTTTPLPGSPCTTAAPAPTPAPSDPCAPTARKYDAHEESLVQQATEPKKESSLVAAMAFPLLGVSTMFSLAAFVAFRVRGGQSFQRLHQMEDLDHPQEGLVAFAC